MSRFFGPCFTINSHPIIPSSHTSLPNPLQPNKTMDKDQQEMQNLGFFPLYKESLKTILSWKKIFTQITLTFILPLSFIFLAHIIVAGVIGSRIWHDEYRLNSNNNQQNIHMYHKLSSNNQQNTHMYHKLSSEWLGYWIFRLVYLTLLFLFSLLSTSAVVYAVACMYSGLDVTFKRVVKILPSVWKRLALTCLWTFFGFFVYNVVSGLVFTVWATTTYDSTFSVVLFYVLLVVFCIGFVYLTAIWQLASVVTVLESSYGLKAMVKGNSLVKGKRWLAWFVFFVLYCVFAGIVILFYFFATYHAFLGVIVGVGCVFLLMNLFLLGYVAQTMLYFVCKSYHREAIDKVGLSSRLGGYLGEFEPELRVNKDIQLGQPQIQV